MSRPRPPALGASLNLALVGVSRSVACRLQTVRVNPLDSRPLGHRAPSQQHPQVLDRLEEDPFSLERPHHLIPY